MHTRRRRTSLALLAPFVLLFVAGPASTDASTHSISPAERSQLLKRFQPVTYFHPDEVWAPASVRAYVKASQLEERHTKNDWRPSAFGAAANVETLPTSRGTCEGEQKDLCYRLNLSSCQLLKESGCYEKHLSNLTSWSRTAVYGTFVEARSELDPLPSGIRQSPRYLLHYFYFYAFDDWRRPEGAYRLVQLHEGDWEKVTIGLSDGDPPKPLFAAVSNHCGGTWRPWRSPTAKHGIRLVELKARTQHPKVYVALGSHANYFSTQTRATRPLQCVWKPVTQHQSLAMLKVLGERVYKIVDQMGRKHELGPKGTAATETRLIEISAPAPRWTRFKGYWSEGNIVFLKRHVVSGVWIPVHHWEVENAPSSPALFGDNTHTIFTSEKWRQD